MLGKRSPRSGTGKPKITPSQTVRTHTKTDPGSGGQHAAHEVHAHKDILRTFHPSRAHRSLTEILRDRGIDVERIRGYVIDYRY
jgi:hypothetical protein